MKTKLLGLIGLSAATLALPFTAFGASITPDSFSATIGVGETVSVDKTIQTDETGAIVDVFFLADNTGSMFGTVNTAQDRASDILNASAFDTLDIAFGVGRYFGDPVESGEDEDSAYDVLQPVTTNKTDVQINGIDNWTASGGGDTPEANLYALQQAAEEGAASDSGASSGEATGWRTGAQRIVAWFGDVPGHQDTVDLPEAISALVDAGVTVVAFNNASDDSGIDGVADSTIDPRNQAGAIVDATGGSILHNFTTLTSDAFVDAIVDAITGAAASFDLIFETAGDTSGVDVSFTCTDALGCTDVTGGESRTFRMDVTGTAPGVYDYTVFARGVDAVESDRITVGDVSVPEPAPLLLIGAGLIGLGFARRRLARSA